MYERTKIKDIVNWLKDPKNKDVSRFIIIFILGFSILTFSKFLFPSKKISSNIQEKTLLQEQNLFKGEVSYEEKLEKQLSEFLGQVDGVGDVRVMLTLENKDVLEPAFNLISSEKNTEEKDNEGGIRSVTEKQTNKQVVMLRKNGEDEPMVTRTVSPKIKGVLVVAEGATSSKVTEQITKATATLLDIPLYKIRVLSK